MKVVTARCRGRQGVHSGRRLARQSSSAATRLAPVSVSALASTASNTTQAPPATCSARSMPSKWAAYRNNTTVRNRPSGNCARVGRGRARRVLSFACPSRFRKLARLLQAKQQHALVQEAHKQLTAAKSNASFLFASAWLPEGAAAEPAVPAAGAAAVPAPVAAAAAAASAMVKRWLM